MHPSFVEKTCFTVRLTLLLCFCCSLAAAAQPAADLQAAYASQARPLIQQYCLACHSTEKHKGDLDLEHFTSIALIRKNVKPWQSMVEQLESEEMPPKGKPKPSPAERAHLLAWVHSFLDAEARARAGDPGYLPLRRLSNAEYDYTIRDLTGVDLQPAKQFPADGAGGEGFTNAAESLADMSPTLLNKYLLAAKEISAHAVLLPDGFRFSPNKTRRDWSDESLAHLRQFYNQFTTDGRINFEPYLAATLRHRDALTANPAAIAQIAASEKLNPKYLAILYQSLTSKDPSFPLDQLREHWRSASEKEAPALAAEIANWQKELWKVVPIGSYRDGNLSRQKAADSAVSSVQTIRLAIKPTPGQPDAVFYLAARELFATAPGATIRWSNPRLEGAKKPTLALKDYPKYGPAYEIDYPAAFADCAKYLNAVASIRNQSETIDSAAKQNDINPARLKRWIDYLALEDHKGEPPLKLIRATPIELLTEKTPKDTQRPAISGWHNKGNDLPAVLSNASDTEEHIPGRASPHKVVVHPLPQEFVAVVWKSPVAARVRITAHIAHAHPSCGNGVAYWLEQRAAAHPDRAAVVAEGALDLGAQTDIPAKLLNITPGDQLILAIDAKNGDHSCDLTEINLTITDSANPAQSWDLSRDIANNIQLANPHPDTHGHKDTWSFVKGPTRPIGQTAAPIIPPDSLLSQWRDAVIDAKRQNEAPQLAQAIQSLLTSPRPAAKDANQFLYDTLLSPDSPLWQNVDPALLPRRKNAPHYALDPARYTPDGSFTTPANSITEIRLPAPLARDRELVLEASLANPSPDRAAQVAILPAAPAADARTLGNSPVVAAPDSPARKKLLQGLDDFRNLFPLFTCYPNVIPLDEVVCLKMYHREDEPLIRLFLDDAQHATIDRLWQQHTFITQQPVAENKYLPLFIGFVTQDQPKELLAYYEGQREPFRQRAEAFEREVEAAIPVQLAKVNDFASRAYRRPLTDGEKSEFASLFQSLRSKGMSSSDAVRGVLARIFVAPSFLFKIETAPSGKEPGPVDDWQLAARLSYFLWSSIPDDELRALAAAGRLHEPAILAAQTRRMLNDDRTRALGIEFGTQWVHVRGFDEYKEKSETRFPEFSPALRSAIYEESIRFFQSLFQDDRPINDLLNANYTYLNDTLAKHYNIPNVTGPQWRKVEGVHQYGRGGLLALASIQTKEAGAARTSPILRGNWVMETLLGEKLPKPPPNVPRLPEEEGSQANLTMRQIVEKHTSDQACFVCHQRIDPLGFAFERYDPIGRLRDKESTGLPIDCRAKLKDGTQFEGMEGLRHYLTTKKQDTITKLFCRRLLGYALGRSVTLSDQTLLDQMVQSLNQNHGHLSAAVLTITASPQFQKIRGTAYTEDQE